MVGWSPRRGKKCGFDYRLQKKNLITVKILSLARDGALESTKICIVNVSKKHQKATESK